MVLQSLMITGTQMTLCTIWTGRICWAAEYLLNTPRVYEEKGQDEGRHGPESTDHLFGLSIDCA